MATFVGGFKIGQIGYMYSRMFLPSQAVNEILVGGWGGGNACTLFTVFLTRLSFNVNL
jgi:hypothetical protein